MLDSTPAVGALPEICATSAEATERFPAASTAYATNEPLDNPVASIEAEVSASTPLTTFHMKSKRAKMDASVVTV